MENNEILEGNKLIAEFMGLKKQGFGANEYFIDNGYRIVATSNGLQYHTSWDWIMPVVEKIEDDGYIVYIKQEICYIRNKTNSIKNLVYMCHYPKITAVFMVVVEFIKWYNENKDNGK